MTRDLRAEVDTDLPETWMPEVNDIIVGVIVRFDQRETKFGERQIAVLDASPTVC